MLQLTFNPGLTLTGCRTTRLRSALKSNKVRIFFLFIPSLVQLIIPLQLLINSICNKLEIKKSLENFFLNEKVSSASLNFLI